MKDILNKGSDRRDADNTPSDEYRDDTRGGRRDPNLHEDESRIRAEGGADRFEEERIASDGSAPRERRHPADVEGTRASDRSGISGPDRAAGAGHTALFASADADRFHSRWTEIQTNFVDEPRRAVEQADDLVSEITEEITTVFTRNREELERQWSAGDEVSTEQLRRTLQSYRSFFERLLSL